MQFFINEILEDDAVREILRTNPAMAEEGREIARRIAAGEDITPAPGLLPLFVLAHLADYTLEKNNALGIPRDITVATLKDVNIWLFNYDAQYGGIGLAEFPWLIHHYTGDLFRLGRLQFRLEKPLAGMPAAEVAIETHIPQGEPLDIEACLASFEQAKAFFTRHFPAYSPAYFMCDSWLLCPNLPQVAAEAANIVRFMRLWTPSPFPDDNSAQAIERIFGFGFDRAKLAEAPERTGLQKRVKQYLLEGGSLPISAGYRFV
ncbi:MAG: DUF5596 domain-containing protein [Clostridia bacterium]|nr:DUF5596 domain-containing protein [Clostridia bacterium]